MRSQTEISSSNKTIHNIEQLRLLWSQEPLQVVMLLFDKSLQHISCARSALAGWSDENYRTHLAHSIHVIRQLQKTLNIEEQSPMAVNMNDLYLYICGLLSRAIDSERQQYLNEAVELLLQIRESLAIYVKKSPKLLQH